MNRHKFAAGLAVALLMGAAAPAFAAPPAGKGKAHAPGQTKTDDAKPPKAEPTKPTKAKGPKSKAYTHLTGGGNVAAGELSVQLRSDKAGQGHVNFTAQGVSVRCRGFEAADVAFSATAPRTATFDTTVGAVTSPCTVTRADGIGRAATLKGTFTDAGKPADDATPATPGPDSVNLTVTDSVGDVAISGLVAGNINIR